MYAWRWSPYRERFVTAQLHQMFTPVWEFDDFTRQIIDMFREAERRLVEKTIASIRC